MSILQNCIHYVFEPGCIWQAAVVGASRDWQQIQIKNHSKDRDSYVDVPL